MSMPFSQMTYDSDADCFNFHKTRPKMISTKTKKKNGQRTVNTISVFLVLSLQYSRRKLHKSIWNPSKLNTDIVAKWHIKRLKVSPSEKVIIVAKMINYGYMLYDIGCNDSPIHTQIPTKHMRCYDDKINFHSIYQKSTCFNVHNYCFRCQWNMYSTQQIVNPYN